MSAIPGTERVKTEEDWTVCYLTHARAHAHARTQARTHTHTHTHARARAHPFVHVTCLNEVIRKVQNEVTACVDVLENAWCATGLSFVVIGTLNTTKVFAPISPACLTGCLLLRYLLTLQKDPSMQSRRRSHPPLRCRDLGSLSEADQATGTNAACAPVVFLQGTVKGGRRQGRRRKRWKDNIREWTGLEFAKSQRAVESRGKWRKLIVKLSVGPQRPSRLRDR